MGINIADGADDDETRREAEKNLQALLYALVTNVFFVVVFLVGRHTKIMKN